MNGTLLRILNIIFNTLNVTAASEFFQREPKLIIPCLDIMFSFLFYLTQQPVHRIIIELFPLFKSHAHILP